MSSSALEDIPGFEGLDQSIYQRQRQEASCDSVVMGGKVALRRDASNLLTTY
jgi:hypothetical protein